LHRAVQIYVFLDYDGTLTPIVNNPKNALMKQETRKVLRTLASKRGYILAVVSGRQVDELRKLVRVRGAYYVGNHGLEIEGPKLRFMHPKAMEFSHQLELLSREIRAQTSKMGAITEHKVLTTSVHYRTVPLADVKRLLRKVRRLGTRRSLRLIYGKKVVELRPQVNWDKGRAVELLIKTVGKGAPVYVGDDRTDEDAFNRIRNGITILVSRRRKVSRARYYLRDINDVSRFLRMLAAMHLRNDCPVASSHFTQSRTVS
jgi:trehalose 6-phosphate phosphatase